MKAFFLITPASRERMWDTVRNQPADITAMTPPGVAPLGSKATYAAQASFKGRLKQLISRFVPLPNVTFRKDIPADTDVVYTWSKIPLKVTKPWVIELDNPYALTYYSRWALHLLKPLIRHWLKGAKYIAFMSDACRATFESLFGKMIPSGVTYPYVQNRTNQRIPSTDESVRFLFIGLDFRIKGGPELVEAWRRAALPNATLTVVTTVTEDMRARYGDIPNLIFKESANREELLAKIYPNADVFVYPTFFDSFGVVLLEALSYGLGIITTNVYATPELVQENLNGKLIPHPILKPKQIADRELVSPIEEHYSKFIAKHLYTGAFYEDLCGPLEAALKLGYEQHATWSEASKALFIKRFAPEIWQANMRKMLS